MATSLSMIYTDVLSCKFPAGLPNDAMDMGARVQSSGRQSDSFVPSTSGSEEEDDLYLLAKSVFDLKVFPSHMTYTYPVQLLGYRIQLLCMQTIFFKL